MGGGFLGSALGWALAADERQAQAPGKDTIAGMAAERI